MSQASSAFQSSEEAEEVTEDDIRDELYCIMTTTVVGIQYYKGWPKVTCPSHPSFIKHLIGMVGPGEEVLLVREPQNPYDRYGYL